MLFTEIFDFYSENHTKQVYLRWVGGVRNVTAVGTRTDRWAANGFKQSAHESALAPRKTRSVASLGY
jgi:hypothetical protein